MFNTECKKTVSKMILSFILITVTLLSGCQKNTTNSANLNSNQEKEQVYFDATVLEVKKNANYAQTECQFRYCGTAIPFLTVRSTAR